MLLARRSEFVSMGGLSSQQGELSVPPGRNSRDGGADHCRGIDEGSHIRACQPENQRGPRSLLTSSDVNRMR